MSEGFFVRAKFYGVSRSRVTEGVTIKRSKKNEKWPTLGIFAKRVMASNFHHWKNECVISNSRGELDCRKEKCRDFNMKTTNKKYGNTGHSNMWLIWVILKDLGDSD